jgi:hypothetical protein
MAEAKAIAANIAWHREGRCYSLEAAVFLPSTGELLRLVGRAGVRNHSFGLLFRNIPIRRFCNRPPHRNPDGTRFAVPHKHTYVEPSPELAWVYIPLDIQIGDINREFQDFLTECKITLTGSYQSLLYNIPFGRGTVTW